MGLDDDDKDMATAASLDPVELSGLSISMLVSDCSMTATLLLWRRWRFDDDDDDDDDARAADRDGRAAAPGPGRLFAGAAAIGTTPLPPATTPPEEPALPPW
jgi:hypothetical protein